MTVWRLRRAPGTLDCPPHSVKTAGEMSKHAPFLPERPGDAGSAILDAAREVAVERGLGQLSLRVVAERAGVSVGTISYRIGDRGALIESLARREVVLTEAEASRWADRMGGIAPGNIDLLSDMVRAWLAACGHANRVPAVMQSELLSAAYRDARLAEPVAAITGAHTDMWGAMLDGWDEADRLARRIAAYCADERPFSTLLGADTDYGLLRASTIRALLRDRNAAPSSTTDAWHMRLVARLEEPARAAFDAGEPPHGAKAAIAEHIADMLIAGGIETLSHRSIAQALAMPVTSLAHHFPAQRDILLGGVEALYRRLRSEVQHAAGERPAGATVIVLGHEMALAARREPGFLPFAIDMRRRRAENVHPIISHILTGSEGADHALTQAYVMAMIGFGLGGLMGRERRYDYEEILRRI